VAAVVALLGAIVLAPGSAQAHTPLVSSNPAAGSVQDVAPDHVVLEFDEPVAADDGSVVVRDSEGRDRVAGVLRSVNGRLVSVVLDPDGPTGAWEVSFRVVGQDGHLVTGDFGFSVGEGGAATGFALSASAAASVIVLLVATGFLVLVPRVSRRAGVA
jgi:methionine-rich copper-binding protein CopC